MNRHTRPHDESGFRDERGIVPVEYSDYGVPAQYGGPGGDMPGGPGGGGFQFVDILMVLLRRRLLIIGTILLGMFLATAYTMRVTPMFRAVSTIEIQREEAQIIEGTNVEPVVVADEQFMATQYELLRSRQLAERVAEVLNLVSNPRYADQSLPREDRLSEVVLNLQRNLRVSPKGRSRIIEIRFNSPFPDDAMRIANAFSEGFIEANQERKFNTTAYARRFLQERLDSTKTLLEESERRLVAYAQREGILDIGSGEDGSNSLDAASLSKLNIALAEAQSERISLEHQYREALANPSVVEMVDSDALRELRLRRSALAADYQEMLGRFKPDFPDMVKLRARIDSLDAEIVVERRSILGSMEGAYKAALAREASLMNRVNELKVDVQDLRERRIEYTILEREVDTNRTQYEALLQRLKEVSVSANVGSSQVSIVDRATMPKEPFSPDWIRSLLLSFLLSSGIGVALALALNNIDDTIKTPEDVRNKLGLSPIGVIPKLTGKDVVGEALRDPRSSVSEAFYSARTALQFSSSEGAPRTILITSTRPAEGKTSSIVSLAMAFARVGTRVLIIDADMRKPSFVADRKASIGLSGLLTSDQRLMDHVIASEMPNLFLLPSGLIPPNPGELLSSRRVVDLISEASEHFDHVLVDSPPVLGFTDAPVLSSICDATMVVCQSGSIRRAAVQRMIGRLRASRANIVGVLLTKFNVRQAGYEYGYAYYSYGKAAYAYRQKTVTDDAERRRKIHLFSKRDATKN